MDLKNGWGGDSNRELGIRAKQDHTINKQTS